MFRLLSKETGMFSVPMYVGILMLLIVYTNSFSPTFINVISSFIAFLGMAMNYILFDKMGLNRHTHLPLFIYCVLMYSIYQGHLDIGISVAIFTNSILLFFLTSDSDKLRKESYFLIGNILAVNYLFLPTAWLIFVFVLLSILSVSDDILRDILRLLLGVGFVFLGYFSVMYILGFTEFNSDYLPWVYDEFQKDFSDLYLLVPAVLFCLLAIADHFLHFNEKSPSSQFKYSFLLAFFITQVLTLVFYMGRNYEYLLLVIFPASIIISRYFRFIKHYWIKEILLWILVLSSLFLFQFNDYLPL